MAPSYDYDTVKARTEDNARGVLAFSQRQLNRVVDPSTRQNAYDQTWELAQARPLLFAFLLFQLLFSFLPIVLFAAFALSTVALALGAAVIFSLFWIGIAVLLLVPTLFLTSSIGILVWIWAAGSFIVAKKLWSVAPAGVKGEIVGGHQQQQQQQQQQQGNQRKGQGQTSHGTNGEKKTGVVLKEEGQ